MEIFSFLIIIGYILFDVIIGFIDGIYINSICGLFLALTVPTPATWIYNKNSYYIGDRKEGDEIYDILVPIHWVYILAFTSWQWYDSLKMCFFF